MSCPLVLATRNGKSFISKSGSLTAVCVFAVLLDKYVLLCYISTVYVTMCSLNHLVYLAVFARVYMCPPGPPSLNSGCPGSVSWLHYWSEIVCCSNLAYKRDSVTLSSNTAVVSLSRGIKEHRSSKEGWLLQQQSRRHRRLPSVNSPNAGTCL